MKKQYIRIEDYDWDLYIYYCKSYYPIQDIIERLYSIECPYEYAQDAYITMTNNKTNVAFTYTNNNIKSSVIVIGIADNASQYFNSIVHEIYHLVEHIRKRYDINDNHEDIATLIGNISQEMYKVCHNLLCNCCKDK